MEFQVKEKRNRMRNRTRNRLGAYGLQEHCPTPWYHLLVPPGTTWTRWGVLSQSPEQMNV